MSLLGIDLGATKLATAIFSEEGKVLFREAVPLKNRGGAEVGKLVTDHVTNLLRSAEKQGDSIYSIGISVPGISRVKQGTVWAPNIPGWIDYPLLTEVQKVSKGIPVIIDSDRACSILGEIWQGKAKGCRDAIFLVVGTGIGAGILVNGEILRGSHDIAGATGWMALSRPFKKRYTDCGCFEYHASGAGIAKVTWDFLLEDKSYRGELSGKKKENLTAHDVFAAYENGDELAARVIDECVGFWGMAVANLVSLFNPELVIFGGGVFGPAAKLLPAIKSEAARWAQPISITQVRIDVSDLGGAAGVYGAGYLALKIHRELMH
jgi:glucokinase